MKTIILAAAAVAVSLASAGCSSGDEDSGSGGDAGTGGVGGSTGGTGGDGGGGSLPPIPPLPASCPTLATGNITVMGQQVQLWVGPAGMPGPLVFYWHGTGSASGEALLLGATAEIEANGGVIASFTTSTKTGANTGNNVWFTGDFAMADEIFACGVEQGVVDPRQVHTAGCSAGGLQASVMAYERSSYLAAVMPNSGGIVLSYELQDPSHVPATITSHGSFDGDYIIIHFKDTTAKFNQDFAAKGGFVVNCDHGGSHCASPTEVRAAQWEFAKAHPYGVTPEPYQDGLPASFPPVCQIIQ